MLFQEYFTLDEIENQIDTGVYNDVRHIISVLATALRTNHLDLPGAMKLLDYYYRKRENRPDKGEIQKWVRELRNQIS